MNSTGPDMDAVGRRLTLARKALGFEQKAELADILECDRGNWTAYEKGKRLIPPRFVSDLLARYGVTYDYIYAGNERGLPEDLAAAIRKLQVAG